MQKYMSDFNKAGRALERKLWESTPRRGSTTFTKEKNKGQTIDFGFLQLCVYHTMVHNLLENIRYSTRKQCQFI